MKKPLRNSMLAVVVALIVISIWYLDSLKSPRVTTTGSDKLSTRIIATNKNNEAGKYEPAHELVSPSGFINTSVSASGQPEPITIGDLIGKKVILVDFWTYSCINCQRTTPYLNAWNEKYKDEGLEIIGVHTPEFQFEHEYNNVARAVQQFGIHYPVILDNNYATWDAYGNHYWPHKYLIDINGFIVYDHIGEGGYDETEQVIQKLLGERMTALAMGGEIAQGIVEPAGTVSVDNSRTISPETYFGAARNTYLGNGIQGQTGIQDLTVPTNEVKNALYLSGKWDFSNEYTENKNAGARILYRFQAKNVYMVASAANGTTIEILQDGISMGTQTIKEDQLYHLIANQDYGEHTLEIIIKNPGLQAYTLTFG